MPTKITMPAVAPIRRSGHLLPIAVALCLSCTQTGCSLLSALMPGCSGWECKTTTDCQEGLSCMPWDEPGQDEPVLLCSRPGDSLTNHDVRNWINLPLYWVVALFVLGLLAVLAYALIHWLVGKIRG